MFGPLAQHFWHRRLHTMHGAFGPHRSHGPHGGHGHHHSPSRDEMIALLEHYQRDLEEEVIAVASRIKALRAAVAPDSASTPPVTRPGGETSPPLEGATDTPVL